MLPNTATTTLQNILAEMDEECKKQAKEKAQENPCHSLSPEKKTQLQKCPLFWKNKIRWKNSRRLLYTWHVWQCFLWVFLKDWKKTTYYTTCPKKIGACNILLLQEFLTKLKPHKMCCHLFAISVISSVKTRDHIIVTLFSLFSKDKSRYFCEESL